MKLYYVLPHEAQWRVEVAALPARTFALKDHALEWARSHASEGWKRGGLESRILLQHDDGEWRLEHAFEGPKPALRLTSKRRPHRPAAGSG